jgi:hypothetical protein
VPEDPKIEEKIEAAGRASTSTNPDAYLAGLNKSNLGSGYTYWPLIKQFGKLSLVKPHDYFNNSKLFGTGRTLFHRYYLQKPAISNINKIFMAAGGLALVNWKQLATLSELAMEIWMKKKFWNDENWLCHRIKQKS